MPETRRPESPLSPVRVLESQERPTSGPDRDISRRSMSRNHTGPQVDEIVRRIRAKLEAERDDHDRPSAEQPATLPLLPIDFSHIAVPLRAADERWQQPALDGRQGGIKRRLATILARLLRRIDHGAGAQQEAFNASTIHTMAAL